MTEYSLGVGSRPAPTVTPPRPAFCNYFQCNADDCCSSGTPAPIYTSSLVRYNLRAVRSVFSDEKKLSIAALSQTFPSGSSSNHAVICHQPLELLAAVLAAAIRMMQQRIRLAAPPYRHHHPSVTSCAVIPALIDQATTRRENR